MQGKDYFFFKKKTKHQKTRFLLNPRAGQGRKEDLAVCLQGIRRTLWAERAPASDGLPTGAGSRLMDGGGQGCLQAGCESFGSGFIPSLALPITQKKSSVSFPSGQGDAGWETSGQREVGAATLLLYQGGEDPSFRSQIKVDQ